MDFSDLLGDAEKRLESALHLTRREARLEARVLVGYALGVDRAWLIGHGGDTPTPQQASSVAALVARREAGEPVAYILGEREFYGRMFKVTPDVLIPRPETELLVEAALERLPLRSAVRVLDLGTGTGCIALTLALERAGLDVTAVDRSAPALAVAMENASLCGVSIHCVLGDWYSDLGGQRFDMIVSNPPYVSASDPHLARGDLPWEPQGALSAGADGMVEIGRIVAGAPAHLCTGGWLLLEHGSDQGDAVRQCLATAEFLETRTLADLAGLPRVTLGHLH